MNSPYFMEYLEDGERSILMSSHITSDLEKIEDSVASFVVSAMISSKLYMKGVEQYYK